MLIACFAGIVSTVNAKDCDPECDGPTPWSNFTSVDLKLSDADGKWEGKWHGEFDHNNDDLLIDMQIPDQEKPIKGTIALVGGRVLLTKGIDSKQNVGDSLDTPVLYMKLAQIVLGRAVPGGPASFEREFRIDLHEPKIGIRFATPSAEGHITAPWSASGKLKKLKGGAVQYDIHLTGGTQDPLGNKTPDIDIKMSGTLSMLGRAVFSDAMSLKGWTVPKDYKTIAEIRAFIAEEYSPGVPDPSKDFTGFWKEKCEQDFGLQIKPAGTDGKYSVSFCGPGGCFEPGTYRPNTFINRDKSYQIVSDTELRVGGGDSFSTYKKCSADPIPKTKAR